MNKQTVSIFWFRRDLRLDDNRGLFNALRSGHAVVLLFIYDKDILDQLAKDDHRLTFIFETLQKMQNELQEKYGSSFDCRYGKPKEIFDDLMNDYDIAAVYTNHDYEPYAKERDASIGDLLRESDIEFHTFKDQVIFEKSEVVKDDGKPYVVYTPYKNKWRQKFNPEHDLKNYDLLDEVDNFYQNTRLPQLTLFDMGFEKSTIEVPECILNPDLILRYSDTRDYPATEGTSHIGPYLRFGLVSVRKIMKQAYSGSGTKFMNELIWREFFMQILWHFPHTAHQAFREKYDSIPWRDAPDDLQKWQDGQTGYPMVDAGMRELNKTGYMHNRVRMVVASFLCKHLLIDWRKGERYFADKLFDYDLSSNVGNWQWAAGSGVDAAPYFRVFNPQTQFEKFDKEGEYVRKWVPEYFGVGYVQPMVDHKEARERAIETYKISLDTYKSIY
jgi:deoxyribodipyrimidine photo-lyase